MALFSAKLCPWTTTGDSVCSREGYIDIDAGGARLGQSCANEDCIEGTCFRAKNEKDGTCRRVLFEGDKGCVRTNYVCTQGLQCYDDVCLKEPSSSTNTKATTDETPKSQDTNLYTYVLYGFIAIMVILLVIMIILMATSSQNVLS